MGITQHHNSVETIQEMVNTHLLGGHREKRRGRLPSQRALNVQGDRTVGINHIASASLIENILRSTGIQTPEITDLTQSIAARAMIDGKGKCSSPWVVISYLLCLTPN